MKSRFNIPSKVELEEYRQAAKSCDCQSLPRSEAVLKMTHHPKCEHWHERKEFAIAVKRLLKVFKEQSR